MFKKLFITGVAVISLTACSSAVKNYAQPSNLLFQNKDINTNTIYVERDDKLCGNDTLEQQNCPTSFYIDDFKAGDFYINNHAQYELKENTYTLKVKNCTKECATHEIKYTVNQNLTNRKLTLSIDQNGLPFIIQSGLNNPTEQFEAPTAKNQEVDLTADALFKFDRYKKADILPENMSKLDELVSKVASGKVMIDHIELIGHTDRLGSVSYNIDLAQKRANTVRDYFVEKGIEDKLISTIITSSAGKSQPVTNGCQDVNVRQDLHHCLQADRRVEIKIKGTRLAE